MFSVASTVPSPHVSSHFFAKQQTTPTTRFYLTINFKITEIILGVVLGYPPVRGEFVVVITVQEQVR